ncbi:MAG: YidC/Oxa1 family membrane protein insertase [Ruminococcus sp.]|jgi:YidC/Oxa1 family membrane protein insertase|nr:YidC/Oxa1 family membrane protein insertase [Ruminococcus sp.]
MWFYDLLGAPFGWLMKLIYDFVGSYGLAIVVFTFIIRLLLLPIGYGQQKNSARMQSVAPQTAKLRKAYKDNPQKFQEEQMKLYKQEHINPYKGCMPALLQLVVLFGILDVVYKPLTHIFRISKSKIDTLVDFAQSNFSVKIGNMNLREELIAMENIEAHRQNYIDGGFSDTVEKIDNFDNSLFGLADLTKIPSLHPDTWNLETITLMLIPFAAGLAQLIVTVYTLQKQKKNGSMPNMGCMTIMMYLMPIMSVVFAFSVPAGVGFYWVVSSVLSLIQSVCLYAYFTPKRIAVISEKDKIKNKDRKPSFMEKMMEQSLAQSAANSANLAKESGLSRNEVKKLNEQKIEEARKRMEEKYGDYKS